MFKFLETPLSYTGTLTNPHKGAFTSKGISVQGNTLADSAALQAVLQDALKVQSDLLPIEEILMIALEAGAKLGGDKHCAETTASSAFLTVAKPEDNPKNPYLNLVIYGTDKKVNAVTDLRREFNQWKTASGK